MLLQLDKNVNKVNTTYKNASISTEEQVFIVGKYVETKNFVIV